MSDVKQRLQGIKFPLEYHSRVLGVYEDQQAAQGRLLSFEIAAALGIILLLQAAFGNWRLAALAFFSLPFALAGGVLAAFASSNILSFAALAGLLAVFGIAVRNSIMLIKHYQHLERSEGVPFGPDLVLRGTQERFAPILMTALAVGLALTPLVIFGSVPGQEIVHPMALVILGGLVTSTLLNLFIIPILYLRFGSTDRSPAQVEHEKSHEQEPQESHEVEQPGVSQRLVMSLTRLVGGSPMQRSNRWMVALLIIVCLQLSACGQTTASAEEDTPPAKVVHIAGSDLSRVILTADAVKRLDLQTAPVREMQVRGVQQKVIPYSAILYDIHGAAWVYTNPSSLTYMRAPVNVDHIDGNQAVLSAGPPSGTQIVTVGAPELYGTEFEISGAGA